MARHRNPRQESAELPLVVGPATPSTRLVRAKGLDGAERKVLREALIALSRGDEPSVADLARGSELPPDRVREALRTLEACDCIGLEGERVRLAYPFTADEVPHEVVSSKGVARTCCAIDALGVGAMLGEPVEIRSRCSYCGAPIRRLGKDEFEGADDAVVFLPPAGALHGKAIDDVCPSINFYCNLEHGRAHADPWAEGGRFVSIADATEVGVAIFGDLLTALESSTDPEAETIRQGVRERYARAAIAGRGCECGSSCCSTDYSAEELARIPVESVLGLGSGNPVRHGGLRSGEVVVDLGSGEGIDVFLAASQVGPSGKVIGVDMTPEMIARAQAAAVRAGANNVEFRPGLIEDLPVEGVSADVILSNCVINLSPDKAAVFREAFRVLKPGGRLVISDVVQERPLGGVEDDCGCVATAMVRSEYLAVIRDAGFRDLKILQDRPWRRGPFGVDASALTLRAVKPRGEVSP